MERPRQAGLAGERVKRPAWGRGRCSGTWSTHEGERSSWTKQRKQFGGAGLEEAEVNEQGARLPRRETRPAAAALERGKMAPSGG